MSTAPRPQTSPSTSSPPNGSCVQPSAASAGTTSVWPINASDGAPGSVPSIRATRDARSSTGSYHSTSSPGPSTTLRRTAAFADSVPTDAPSTRLLTQRFRISTPSRSPTSLPRTGSVMTCPSSPGSLLPHLQRNDGGCCESRSREEAHRPSNRHKAHHPAPAEGVSPGCQAARAARMPWSRGSHRG